jgi:sterol desaturase/sphingolipid hydroxylase (fatty acid hydroxylase superfamily)
MIYFIASIVYASVLEWLLHRYVMHKPLGKFDYPFRAHAIIHHGKFKADKTYTLVTHPDDGGTIPMAWWNGPVLIFIGTIPTIFPSYILGETFSGIWLLSMIPVLAVSLYYGTYEYIHWCMHSPRDRFVERLGIYKSLNAHHLLHHRYPRKNFNVVLPIVDFLFGTLVTPSTESKMGK